MNWYTLLFIYIFFICDCMFMCLYMSVGRRQWAHFSAENGFNDQYILQIWTTFNTQYLSHHWLIWSQTHTHAHTLRFLNEIKYTQTSIHNTYTIKQTHIILLFQIYCPYVFRFSTMNLNSMPFCFRSINTDKQQQQRKYNRTKLLEWMNWTYFFCTILVWFFLLFIRQYKTYRRNEKKKKTDFFSFSRMLVLFFCYYCWFVRNRNPMWRKKDVHVFVIVDDFFFSSFQKSKH